MILLDENESHVYHNELDEDEHGEHHQVVGQNVERRDQRL
jgi:hypothetical protein